MVTEGDVAAIIIGIGIGLVLGVLVVVLSRRRVIGRLAFLLLLPLAVLVPTSWPLAGVLSLGGQGEQLRCAVVLVIPLSVASWLVARLAGLDIPAGDGSDEEA